MKPIIFVDMDGVTMNFELHYENLFGHKCTKVSDDRMWNNIRSHGILQFFMTMPTYPEAKTFIKELVMTGLPVMFLTSCPREPGYEDAAVAKKCVAKTEFGEDKMVIPMRGGKNKKLFIQQVGDILIDDFEENIEAWKSHGGFGIHHKSFAESLKTVQNYMSTKQFQIHY